MGATFIDCCQNHSKQSRQLKLRQYDNYHWSAAMGDPEWKASLNEHHSKLRTGLLIEKVLSDLRPLLTAGEYSSIEEKENDIDRVDELVKILLTKDRSTFQKFCSALENNGYPRWANRLRGKGLLSA